MINSVTMEGVLTVKPVLLESSRQEPVTEFNLEHTELATEGPLVYSWRCRATGELAKDICQIASKGQVLIIAGKFVQVTVEVAGKFYPVVKLRVEQCAYGRIRSGGMQ